MSIKSKIKKLRNAIVSVYAAPSTIDHLHTLRNHEVEIAIKLIRQFTHTHTQKERLLELGAGSGYQAMVLQKNGYDVYAIELEVSHFDKKQQVFPITIYDGQNIPFGDKEFDIVFSSNVLEHVADLHNILGEIKRVLKDDGLALIILPTPIWCFFTIITSFLRLSPNFYRPHGAIAKTIFQEIVLFRKNLWIEHFEKNGFQIVKYLTNGLFYTGASIMDSRLSIATRHKLSKILGSSCHIFVLKKQICAEHN